MDEKNHPRKLAVASEELYQPELRKDRKKAILVPFWPLLIEYMAPHIFSSRRMDLKFKEIFTNWRHQRSHHVNPGV
jgi:hypothetical protein